MRLRFDATRSASASADNRRTASPCRKGGRWVNARRAFPTRTGDLRPAAPLTATAHELAKTAAREVPAAPADRRTWRRGVAAPKRGREISCLQRIEKAQTWKFSRWPRTGWEQPNEGAEALRSPQDLHAPAAPPSARGGALNGRQRKFSCLQPIEKAQNVEMFSATEDGLGATDRERGGSFARRTICMRPRHRHRRARRPEKRHAKIFLPATH